MIVYEIHKSYNEKAVEFIVKKHTVKEYKWFKKKTKYGHNGYKFKLSDGNFVSESRIDNIYTSTTFTLDASKVEDIKRQMVQKQLESVNESIDRYGNAAAVLKKWLEPVKTP